MGKNENMIPIRVDVKESLVKEIDNKRGDVSRAAIIRKLMQMWIDGRTTIEFFEKSKESENID